MDPVEIFPDENALIRCALGVYIGELHRIRVVEDRKLPPGIQQALHDEIEKADALQTVLRDGRPA